MWRGEEDLPWQFGANDPTLMGWSTVALYVVAAILCGIVGARASSQTERAWRRFFWWSLAAFLMLFACNKQLDLQTWGTHLGREVALRQGWFAYRRFVQACCFVVAGAGFVAFLGLMIRACRHRWREQGGAVLGLALVAGYALLRLATFQHVDTALGLTLDSKFLLAPLELAGAGCIAVSAATALWNRRCTAAPSNR